MPDKKVVQTDKAPQAIGPYSQAIQSGDLLFCSGQLGLDPQSGKLVSADVADQARQVMQNLAAVLEAANTSFDQVIKTTIFLVDLGDFATVNGIYGEFFQQAPPARATVQVAALPLGGKVEIEAIARQ